MNIALKICAYNRKLLFFANNYNDFTFSEFNAGQSYLNYNYDFIEMDM